MAEITVLMPTHDHGPLIRFAIDSVLRQTITDWELLVVGDGAPASTGEIVKAVSRGDPRVRWLPHAKGKAHGELWRHEALLQATGRIVCYLCDDDLWLPHHLAVMRELLEQADFAKTLHTAVQRDQRVTGLPGDITVPAVRQRMLRMRWNCFGPTCAGHTMEAYRRLPQGWNPRPEGIFSDLWFWRQWLSQDWCRFAARPVPTSLHLASVMRGSMDGEERLAETRIWADKVRSRGFDLELMALVLADWEMKCLPIELAIMGCRAPVRPDEAAQEDHLRWVIAGYQQPLAAVEQLSNLYLRQGKAEQAIASLEQARAGSAGQAQFHLIEAGLLLGLMRPGAARRSLGEAVRLSDQDASLLHRAAQLFIRAGDVHQAAAAVRRAAQLAPDQEEISSLLGQLEEAVRAEADGR